MKVIIIIIVIFAIYIALVNLYHKVVSTKYTYYLEEGVTRFYKHYMIGSIQAIVMCHKADSLKKAKEYKHRKELKYGKKIYSRET